jgi:hypothetical protein
MIYKSFLAIAIFCFAPYAISAEGPPTTGTLLGDARLIITSKKDDVRLWSHPPRVLVLYDGKDVSPRLENIRNVIEENVSPFYADKVFGAWTYSELSADFGEGSHRRHMRHVDGGPAGHELEVHLDEGRVWVTDIVIAMASRPKIALLNALWGLERRNNRAMMRAGRANCSYHSNSRKGVRVSAYVTNVRYDHLERDIEECVLEELIHTLGPFIDAKGSSHFTFDDEVGLVPAKQANDILLLRSVYESGARPGDPPDAVLDHLKELTKEVAPEENRP